jgi:hypothetical protein
MIHCYLRHVCLHTVVASCQCHTHLRENSDAVGNHLWVRICLNKALYCLNHTCDASKDQRKQAITLLIREASMTRTDSYCCDGFCYVWTAARLIMHMHTAPQLWATNLTRINLTSLNFPAAEHALKMNHHIFHETTSYAEASMEIIQQRASAVFTTLTHQCFLPLICPHGRS